MDVLDIAWSPSLLLASASIDNKVIVWNCTQLSSGCVSSIVAPLIVLHEHTSFVKGVAFDPLGTYLSTLSADNKCLIYNTKTFALESSVTDPLEHSIDKSIFRRHSWAPDGSALCLCSAVKNNKASGTVLKRKTWQCAADLIGHSSSTTCCKFNPKLLYHSSGDACCVVAVGDQLGAISIWSSAQASALLVIEEMFASSIVDISWSGKIMCAASVDGSIALVVLDDVLGSVLSGDETEKHLRRLYGEQAKIATSLAIEQQLSLRQQATVSNNMMNPTASVTKSGKKRLQPTLLSSSGDAFASASNNTHQPAPRSEKPAGTAMTYYRDRVVCCPQSVKNLEKGITVAVRNDGSKVVCRRVNDATAKTILSTISRVDRHAVHIWDSVVAADVTACASFVSNECDGLVVVGSSDGMIYIFSAESGVILLPPLIIGGSIMHVDCILGEMGTLVMAATVLGVIYVWSYGANGLHLMYRTSLEPVLISTRNTNPSSTRDIVVESVTLEANTDLQSSVWHEGESGGGSWLRCHYSSSCGVWMRSSDTCHVLCR